MSGYLCLFCAILAGVINFLLIKFAFLADSQVRSADMFFWGFAGNALCSSLCILPHRRFYPEIKYQLLHGLKLHCALIFVTTFGALLSFYAMRESHIGIVSVLFRTDIIFTIMFGVFFLNEVLHKLQALLIVFVFIGFLMLSNLNSEVTFLVVLVAISSQFFYSLQSLLIKKYARGFDSVVLAYIRGVLIAIVFGLIYLNFFSFRTFPFSTTAVIILSQFLGVFIFRIFYFHAHKSLSIGTIHLYLLMLPVSILFASVLLYGEPLSTQKLIGTAIVITGLAAYYKSTPV